MEQLTPMTIMAIAAYGCGLVMGIYILVTNRNY